MFTPLLQAKKKELVQMRKELEMKYLAYADVCRDSGKEGEREYETSVKEYNKLQAISLN
jgi:hypothetical protein